MKYLYKTVSLEGFLQDNKDARIGFFTPTNQLGQANKASVAVEHLLNHYAKDGWEYVRSEEFNADFFRSTAASIFSDKNNNPRLQMFIFRQPFTEELEKKYLQQENARLESERLAYEQSGASKGRMPPEVADARCPNCEALVNKMDKKCWKCNASFGELSAWRPQPI